MEHCLKSGVYTQVSMILLVLVTCAILLINGLLSPNKKDGLPVPTLSLIIQNMPCRSV